MADFICQGVSINDKCPYCTQFIPYNTLNLNNQLGSLKRMSTLKLLKVVGCVLEFYCCDNL